MTRHAYYEWLSNERNLDDLWYTVLGKSCRDPARDRVICGRMSKILPGARKKPTMLDEHLDELEQMHPWSRALANKLFEIEDCLG